MLGWMRLGIGVWVCVWFGCLDIGITGSHNVQYVLSCSPSCFIFIRSTLTSFYSVGSRQALQESLSRAGRRPLNQAPAYTPGSSDKQG